MDVASLIGFLLGVALAVISFWRFVATFENSTDERERLWREMDEEE